MNVFHNIISQTFDLKISQIVHRLNSGNIQHGFLDQIFTRQV